MTTKLTPEDIREQARVADDYGLTRLLRLKACPVDLIERYAFPPFNEKGYSIGRKVRAVARTRKQVTLESMTSYIIKAVKEDVNARMIYTLDEFFGNPNFSLTIFTDLLDKEELTKSDARRILALALHHKDTPTELLELAMGYEGSQLRIASHPNISDDIARQIISNSYARTILPKKEAIYLLQRLKARDTEYDGEYALQRFRAHYLEVTLALIRNPNVSVEIIEGLIPTEEVVKSRQAGIPETLRALLRALPSGQKREEVVNMLSNLKQFKVHPMSKKLIAQTTENQELLTQLVYGADNELSNIAAANPAVKPEDRVALVLLGKKAKSVKKVKTRF